MQGNTGEDCSRSLVALEGRIEVALSVLMTKNKFVLEKHEVHLHNLGFYA